MEDSLVDQSSSSCDSQISSRFDQIFEYTSSSTTEDDEHAHLYHRFDSVKSLIDELYDEVTYSDTSKACLHNELIVKNEGQSMGKRRHETYAYYLF
jgi:hypothetical protein